MRNIQINFSLLHTPAYVGPDLQPVFCLFTVNGVSLFLPEASAFICPLSLPAHIPQNFSPAIAFLSLPRCFLLFPHRHGFHTCAIVPYWKPLGWLLFPLQPSPVSVLFLKRAIKITESTSTPPSSSSTYTCQKFISNIPLNVLSSKPPSVFLSPRLTVASLSSFYSPSCSTWWNWALETRSALVFPDTTLSIAAPFQSPYLLLL